MNAPTLFAYLSKEAATTLCKMAEGRPSSVKPILAGAAGMGIGTLAGAGAAHLANKGYQHFNGGQSIPLRYLAAAAPVVGAGLGLAYNLAQAHQMEALREAASSDKV